MVSLRLLGRTLQILVLLLIAHYCVPQAIGVGVVHAGDEVYGPDARRRALAREAKTRGDAGSYALCLAKEIQSRSPNAVMNLITASNDTLNAYAEGDRIVFAKDHKPPTPEFLHQVRAEWQQEAEYWYSRKARELKVGDQFVTHHGEYRWTKVVAGPQEVWRAPDGLLVGDVVGQMTHYDAQKIDQALKKLYEQAKEVSPGEWRWPKKMPANLGGGPFDAQAYLKYLMDPGARFFAHLISSIGGILEPNVPWRLPIQEGNGIENPSPTREGSALRSQSAHEVLNNMARRWFWSSSVCTDSSRAHVFNGKSGNVVNQPRDFAVGSVRFVARPR